MKIQIKFQNVSPSSHFSNLPTGSLYWHIWQADSAPGLMFDTPALYDLKCNALTLYECTAILFLLFTNTKS